MRFRASRLATMRLIDTPNFELVVFNPRRAMRFFLTLGMMMNISSPTRLTQAAVNQRASERSLAALRLLAKVWNTSGSIPAASIRPVVPN